MKRSGKYLFLLVILMIVCMVGWQINNEKREQLQQEKIAGLFQQIKEESVSEEAYLDAIRDYAYANLECAGDSDCYKEVREQIKQDKLPWAKKIYSLMETDTIESVGYCEGTAYVLAAVYNMLGYNSCELDMAVFDENGNVVGSHVVTLVEIDDKWIIEDATFNLTLMEKGEHLSIESIIEKVKQGENDDICVVSGTNVYKRVCFTEPEYDGNYQMKLPVEFYPYEFGFYSYLDMEPEEWDAYDELYGYFEEEGLEKNILGIYAYPYNIYWPSNSRMNLADKWQFKKSIVNY